MNDGLSVLLADGVIEQVIGRLKSGKEADIYLVQHAGEIVAAKLYKEKAFRSFRNDAAYREGRTVRSSRTQRAIDKGSRFGQQAAEDEWKSTESEVLHKLFAAGARVPKPYVFYEGVLLMEAVIDAEGHPAPRLIDAQIPKERAAELYAEIRSQAIRMLLADLIHGDLSPYNVLLAWNGPTLIDFPQVVGAAHNNRAEFFFTRDLETIRRFFAALDPSLAAHSQDASVIWRAYVRRELREDFAPRPQAPQAQPQHRGEKRREHGGRGPQHKPHGQPQHPQQPQQQRGQRPPGGQQQPQQQRPPRDGNPNRGSQAPAVSYKGQPPPQHAAAPPPAAEGATAAPAHRRRRRRGGRGRGRGGGGRDPGNSGQQR